MQDLIKVVCFFFKAIEEKMVSIQINNFLTQENFIFKKNYFQLCVVANTHNPRCREGQESIQDHLQLCGKFQAGLG